MNLELIFAAVLRLTAPILMCATGSLFCDKSGVTNIALEGNMLLGSFFGVMVSFFTGSWILGVLAAVFAGILASLFFALITLKLSGVELVVGFSMNVLLSGLTTYMLRTIFGVSGSLVSERIVGIPAINLPGLSDIPLLGGLFNGQNILIYFSFISVLIAAFIFKRTQFGLKVISCGENPQAAATVGINVLSVRMACLIISGVMCGLAGAQLSLGFLSLYTENMTAGRGFIALMTVVFARGNSWKVLLVAVVFGAAEMLSNQLQLQQLPSYLILIIPYICVVLLTFFKHPEGKKVFKAGK